MCTLNHHQSQNQLAKVLKLVVQFIRFTNNIGRYSLTYALINVTIGNHVLLCTQAQAMKRGALFLTTHEKK